MALFPVSPAAIRRLLTEIESSSRGDHILAVGGPSELAPVLHRQFLRGGAASSAVRVGGPEGAAVYVHILVGEPTEEDEAVLRRASRAHVPVIAVVAGHATDDLTIPYVLATDVVRIGSGQGFPLEGIARVVAARLGEAGAPLAARVPLLRAAVCDQLVTALARRNAVVAGATWIRRADLPALALNQLRLVLRLAQAYGEASGLERGPELAATLGAAVGLRAVARTTLDLMPVAGWGVKTAVAYAGTRALGEAARRRFALAPTPRPAVAAPGAP